MYLCASTAKLAYIIGAIFTYAKIERGKCESSAATTSLSMKCTY